MSERHPGDRGRTHGEFVQELASALPDQPLSLERVKQTNVGQKPAAELAELELGPNDCTAA